MNKIKLQNDHQRKEKYSTEFWEMHVRNWKASKMSQRAYCNQEKIKYTTFAYWRRVFSTEQIHSKKSFIPLKVISENLSPPSVTRPAIQVTLMNGMIISIPSGFTMDEIASLISHLGCLHA